VGKVSDTVSRARGTREPPRWAPSAALTARSTGDEVLDVLAELARRQLVRVLPNQLPTARSLHLSPQPRAAASTFARVTHIPPYWPRCLQA